MAIGVLRGAPWVAIAAASGTAGVLLLISSVWPDRPFAAFFLGLGLAALGAAACFVLDEPAAEVVDAAPVPLRQRSIVRGIALAVPLGLGALAAVAREVRLAETTAWGTLLEVLGLTVVGLTVAAVLRRRGQAAPGELAATGVACFVLLLVLKEPTAKWVAVLPSGPDPHWDRTLILWLAIIAACLVTLARSTRDLLDD
jgi:hypothetical protein